jgi:hypothetical protein
MEDEKLAKTGIRRILTISLACSASGTGVAKEIDVSLSGMECALSHKRDELMGELMRRALEQNPDLARQLKLVGAQQEAVGDMRMEQQAARGRELIAKWKEQRKRERHIRYNDARNINALTGLRRSAIYQGAPRQRKIELELENYYSKYGIEPPPELLKELAKLRRAKELYLKRVKRDAQGRIIRTRMAG